MSNRSTWANPKTKQPSYFLPFSQWWQLFKDFMWKAWFILLAGGQKPGCSSWLWPQRPSSTERSCPECCDAQYGSVGTDGLSPNPIVLRFDFVRKQMPLVPPLFLSMLCVGGEYCLLLEDMAMVLFSSAVYCDGKHSPAIVIRGICLYLHWPCWWMIKESSNPLLCP